MSSVEFTVIGKPEPAGSKRAFRNKHTGLTHVVDANKNAKPHQAAIAAAAAEAMDGRELFSGPLYVRFVFYLTRPKGHYGTGRNSEQLRPGRPPFPVGRPDVLKLARGVEDALSGVCFRDDAQIVREVLVKLYGAPARVEVLVQPLSATEATA